jgi:hypothetical protein
MQQHVESDEPEPVAAPILPESTRPTLGRDDPSMDGRIDTMTEEALLRGLKEQRPEEPSEAFTVAGRQRHGGGHD